MAVSERTWTVICWCRECILSEVLCQQEAPAIGIIDSKNLLATQKDSTLKALR